MRSKHPKRFTIKSSGFFRGRISKKCLMDTDDLTEMAWDIIVCAARVSDTLKAELGSMASQYRSEDEWLHGIRDHLKKIGDAPVQYVVHWDLENEESVTPARIKDCTAELCRRVDKILALPMSKRAQACPPAIQD
jgi:hypothetical protein